MSRRAPVSTRAPALSRTVSLLPEAADVVRPELIGGEAGAPLEIARWFHNFFFWHASLAIKGGGWIVLQDVVIGRPSPLLRAIQHWGSTVDPSELLRVSTDELADQFGLDAGEREAVCTEAMLFVGALRSSPCLGDDELERRTIARLVVSTTSMLASAAPYVRIGDGVVWAYRPSNMLASWRTD